MGLPGRVLGEAVALGLESQTGTLCFVFLSHPALHLMKPAKDSYEHLLCVRHCTGNFYVSYLISIRTQGCQGQEQR